MCCLCLHGDFARAHRMVTDRSWSQLFPFCYGLNACVPPKFVCWQLLPVKMMELWAVLGDMSEQVRYHKNPIVDTGPLRGMSAAAGYSCCSLCSAQSLGTRQSHVFALSHLQLLPGNFLFFSLVIVASVHLDPEATLFVFAVCSSQLWCGHKRGWMKLLSSTPFCLVLLY